MKRKVIGSWSPARVFKGKGISVVSSNLSTWIFWGGLRRMVKLPFGTHHEFSMRRDNLRLVCPAGVHNYRRLTKEMASVGLLEGFEEMLLTNG